MRVLGRSVRIFGMPVQGMGKWHKRQRWSRLVSLPAVDQNRMVPSPPLYFYYLPNDIVDSPQVIALPIRIPVHDVELGHLVDLP